LTAATATPGPDATSLLEVSLARLRGKQLSEHLTQVLRILVKKTKAQE
jgi:hypothetical protein